MPKIIKLEIATTGKDMAIDLDHADVEKAREFATEIGQTGVWNGKTLIPASQILSITLTEVDTK